MNEKEALKLERLFSLIGLARRAGRLHIGQDKVLAAARSGVHMLVITSNDVSAAVLRSLRPHEESGAVVRIELSNADRTELGGQAGVSAAQIVALPEQDGLARKIYSTFDDGSDANE